MYLCSGLKFAGKAVSIKSNVVGPRGEGQINLHQKFELDISKNGRDITQLRTESKMYTLLMISLYCVYSR